MCSSAKHLNEKSKLYNTMLYYYSSYYSTIEGSWEKGEWWCLEQRKNVDRLLVWAPGSKGDRLTLVITLIWSSHSTQCVTSGSLGLWKKQNTTYYYSWCKKSQVDWTKKKQIGNAKICLKQVQKKARRQFVISKKYPPSAAPLWWILNYSPTITTTPKNAW